MRFLRRILVVLVVISLCASALYITASAGSIAYGAATVGATSLNIRTGPGTTYPVGLTVSHNEKLVILEKTSAEWYHAVYNGTQGYVASLYLTNVVTAENFTTTGRLTGDDVFIRSAPSTSASQLSSCGAGTTVKIIGINSGWYKVVYKDATGYIRSDFVTLVSETTKTSAPASSSPASSPAASPSPAPSGAANSGDKGGQKPAALTSTTQQQTPEQLSLRQQVVKFALQYVGGEYVYGGQSPSEGFDCSGLVYYVYHHFNFDVTRTASSQYANDGTSVKKADLLPGDLVFFSSNGGYSVTHVGIYTGNNQFVHASTPKNGILVSNLDSSYYTSVWFGGKRILS